jgi:trk system potassium uptake protein TrkA
MIKRQFAIIGLGRFGSAMATTLLTLGQDVLGIDSDEERVQELSDRVPHLLAVNASDPKALQEAGVGDVDVAVISIGANVEASLLIVMAVKEMGVKFVVAKSTTEVHGRILERLGVDRVIYPEREAAIRMAHSLVVPNVIDYISLSRDFSIIEIPAPEMFVGKTLREVDLRAKHGLTLIAIKRSVNGIVTTDVSPSPDERMLAGDTVALVGSNKALVALERLVIRKQADPVPRADR